MIEWYQSEFNTKVNITQEGKLSDPGQSEEALEKARWLTHNFNDWHLGINLFFNK